MEKYTLEEIYKIAGDDLTNLMKSLNENSDDELIVWFYSPNKALDNKTPYDMAKENPSKLEKKLKDILYAGQGS